MDPSELEPTHESVEDAIEDTVKNGEDLSSENVDSFYAHEGPVVIRADTDREAYFLYENFVVDTLRGDVRGMPHYDDERGAWTIDSGHSSVRIWAPTPVTGINELFEVDEHVREDVEDLLELYAEDTGQQPIEVVSSDDIQMRDRGTCIFGPPGWEEGIEEWEREFAFHRAIEELDGIIGNPNIAGLIEIASEYPPGKGQLKDAIWERMLTACKKTSTTLEEHVNLLPYVPDRGGKVRKLIEQHVRDFAESGELKRAYRILDEYLEIDPHEKIYP